MNKHIVSIRKFAANTVSGLIFWNKELRHKVREGLYPFSPCRCVNMLTQMMGSLEEQSPVRVAKEINDSHTIWQCWFQGLDDRPEIVTECMDSVKKYAPEGYRIVYLTNANYKDYVCLPEEIERARRSGIIADAHFSDIIRVYLLAAYGGIWIDATCLMTSCIPDYILEAPFFCYRSQGEFAYTYIQSCFMKALPCHPMISKLYSFLVYYWKHNDYLIHYFLVHLMFKSLVSSDKEMCNEFQRLNRGMDDAPMHYMFYALKRGAKYSECLKEKASKQSFIHKLTYKDKNMFNNNRQCVSLLVSTYNWPEALRLSIESVARQTVLPLEVIIADDGSNDDTRKAIAEMQNFYPELDITHVWHPDEGFRKTIILNKAIAIAKGEYIIQIDGDVVLDKHFIQDHLELMEPGYYVCGSRTKIDERMTKEIIKTGVFKTNIGGFKLSFIMNSFRSKVLRHFMALRYARKIDHMRGCNVAFWRSDLIKVNGYNEDLLQWGHEDGELIYRLHFAGVKKKALKMGGVVFHLWHVESSRSNEQYHLDVLDKVISGRIKWCDNGINKYLS